MNYEEIKKLLNNLRRTLCVLIQAGRKLETTTEELAGLYLPSVTDNGDNTVTFAYTPSREGMEEVAPVTVTLPSAGDPDGELSAEVTRMKEMQPNLFAETYQTGNLLDKTLVNKEGYYVNSSGGFTALTSATATEEYIDISKAEGTHLAVYACHNTQTATSYWRAVYRMCFYNADKVKIGYHDGGGQKDYAYYGVMEIPEGAVYVRVSFTSGTNVDNYVIRRGPADMELPYWTPYEPVREAVVVPEDLNQQLEELDRCMAELDRDMSAMSGNRHDGWEDFSVCNLRGSKSFSQNDITLVGDELWMSKESSQYYENGTMIFRHNAVSGGFEELGTCDCDFGHLNTMDYSAENDCLIFGNGANEEPTEADPTLGTVGNYFVVVKHPLTLGESATVAGLVAEGKAVKYDLDGTIGGIGYKVQALWGGSNLGDNNLVYLISNNGTRITKVLLDRGEDGDFNGGLTLLETASLEGFGVQGADIFGDTLYLGGQTGGNEYAAVREISLSDYTEIRTVKRKVYSSAGAPVESCVQGICVNAHSVWLCVNVVDEDRPVWLTKYKR